MFSHNFAEYIRAEMMYYLPLFYRFKQHQYLQLTKEESDLLVLYMSHLLNRVRKVRESRKKQIMLRILLLFIAEIGNILDHYFDKAIDATHQEEDLFMHFFELLEKNYATHHLLKFYADALSKTPRYLSKVVKKVCGQTAGQYIDEYIISKAKILLRKTDMNVSKIRSTLNFRRASTFSRFFTRIAGITPANYRKKHPKSASE
jgi:AraC-like DNA-binding protein